MRKLVTQDVFKAARLIKKLDIKDKLKAIYFDVKKNKDEEDPNLEEKTGIDIAYIIFEECTDEKLEVALYEFLSGPFEKTPEEIKMLEIDKLFEALEQLAVENNLIDFFKKAGSLMK